MSNNINVSLDTSVTPNVLKVHDSGGHHVSKHSKPQTITWNLTGPLAQGAFVPMCEDEPGFEWMTSPAPSSTIFSAATIGANTNSLSIIDTHTSGTSDGTWIYKLRASYNDTIYETTSSVGVSDTTNNPIIVNR